MDSTHFLLNDRALASELPPGTPLLDLLRGEAGLTGVKEACREGDCGACAVLVGRPTESGLAYRALASCLLPLAAVDGCHVVTIEGLNQEALTPVQEALVEAGAIQCGFCTPGFVVALTGFLLSAPRVELAAALSAIAGNLCRCTGYASIKRAAASLCERFAALPADSEERLTALLDADVVPTSFAEARARLKASRPRPSSAEIDPGTIPVAGGTDLYVQRPAAMRDASLSLLGERVRGDVWLDGDAVCVGATTSFEALRDAPLIRETVPGIERFMELVCSRPIREQATVGGNIVNASPIGDVTIMLLALGAELGLERAGARRVVALPAFYRGYKKLDLEPGEIVEWVRFRRPAPGSRFNFEKVSKRTHLDIASVNSAISIQVEEGVVAEARVAAGGVAPVPLVLTATGEALRGRSLDADTVREAARVADTEITPIDDVRGSARYKRLLLRQLVYAHFCVLFGLEEVVA